MQVGGFLELTEKILVQPLEFRGQNEVLRRRAWTGSMPAQCLSEHQKFFISQAFLHGDFFFSLEGH
ncbi:hypothetical protein D3C87_1651650 [compost metagenome]